MAPKWSEIDLMDFPATSIPLTSVTDITPSPLSSKYRYWGSGLTTVFGNDYTGRSPNEVPPKALGMSADGGCGRLVSECKPHFEIKEFITDKGLFGRALVLRLPLSDDEKTVSHGINVYHFEPLSGSPELSKFFDEVFSKLNTDFGPVV